MGRVEKMTPGVWSLAAGLWLGLGLLVGMPARSMGQTNTITCGATLASTVGAGGTADWTLTSPGGPVRINTCSTGGDTKLKISGVW